MPNVELVPKGEVASFRKLAIGSWKTTYDPTVYGSLTLRMDKALEYIEAFRKVTGRRLTVTHLVTKAVAECLRRCPDANAILRFNKIYLRKKVTLSVLVVQPDDVTGKVDLTAAKIDHADQKTLVQIADEMEETIRRVRNRQEQSLEKGKSTIQKIPFLLMNVFTWVMHFLMYTLNLDLSSIGMPKDAFGAVTITNVGSLGLDTAFVPLVPYTATPMFVAPGAIKDEPVVEDGKVVPGKVMNLCASFDHRFIDGYHAGVLAKTFHEMFEDPFNKFDDLAKFEAEQKRAQPLPEKGAA